MSRTFVFVAVHALASISAVLRVSCIWGIMHLRHASGVSCIMHHPACFIHASSIMRHASCIMRHACVHHASIMRHASSMHHASCVMHHASGVSCIWGIMHLRAFRKPCDLLWCEFTSLRASRVCCRRRGLVPRRGVAACLHVIRGLIGYRLITNRGSHGGST